MHLGKIEVSNLKAFLPAIVWALVIFGLSTTAGENLPQIPWDLTSPDKWGHAIVYLIFALLLFYGFRQKMGMRKTTILLVLVISISYGILMEIVQYSFFPGRYFELNDIIANIIGALLSVLILKFFYK